MQKGKKKLMLKMLDDSLTAEQYPAISVIVYGKPNTFKFLLQIQIS